MNAQKLDPDPGSRIGLVPMTTSDSAQEDRARADGDQAAGPVSHGQRARPAIVSVDDDPGVSRAVARDLRRRYGDRHRIVRAESGAAALEALTEMKLRGRA